MKDSELRTRSKNFAVQVILACDEIEPKRGRNTLIGQLIRSATSVGANIHEATYASSKADFINKFHIALKECEETEFWLELLVETNSLSQADGKKLIGDCGIIKRMLVKSVNTAKGNEN